MSTETTSEMISKGIENGISLYQSFLQSNDEVVISISEENPDCKEYRLVNLSSPDEDSPSSLNIFPLIHFESDFLDSITRNISIVLIAFGLEVLDKKGQTLDLTEEESDRIQNIDNLLAISHEFETYFQSTDGGWTIKAKSKSFSEDIELFDVLSKKKLQTIFVEKFLGFLFASKDKSVLLAEGTLLNMCGCALYPEDDNSENDDN